MWQKFLKFVSQVPWWFLISYTLTFAFAYWKVGSVEQEPEGNAILGFMLWAGAAFIFAKLVLPKPKA